MCLNRLLASCAFLPGRNYCVGGAFMLVSQSPFGSLGVSPNVFPRTRQRCFPESQSPFCFLGVSPSIIFGNCRFFMIVSQSPFGFLRVSPGWLICGAVRHLGVSIAFRLPARFSRRVLRGGSFLSLHVSIASRL